MPTNPPFRLSLLGRWRESRSWRRLAWFFALATVTTLPPTARAQTVVNVTWDGGTGNLSEARWRILPIELIQLLGIDYNLFVDGGSATVSLVNITGSAAIRTLTISSGDTVVINNGATLELEAVSGTGTLANAGTLQLAGTSSTTNLILSGGAFTFSGSGSVTLDNSTNNRIHGDLGTESLTNASGHTIQGAGQLGLNLLSITNQGTILANRTTALTIDPNASGFTNTGTLRAMAGGTLVLASGTYNNTGGTIEAAVDSHVDLDAATVSGGTLTSVGTGHFHIFDSSSLANLTLSSGTNVEIGNAQRLNLSGTITNQGTIKLLSSGSSTDLRITGATTLQGGGTITATAFSGNSIYGSDSSHVLTNVDNTIQGAGQIGINSMGLINSGTILANHSTAPLTIDPSSAGVINTGTLRSTAGATLVLSGGTFTNFSGANNGLIQAQTNSFLEFNSAAVSGGTVDLAAGAKLELNSSTVSGGTLTMTSTSVIETHSGTNTLGSTLTVPNGGTVEVRNATGLKLLTAESFTNNGNISLASTGSSTDLIVSGGDLTLAGTGTVTLSNRTSNHIYGQAVTDRLLNHNTIQGAGQIGLNSMGLVNAGTIVANQSNSLTIDPSSAGVTNTGTLRSTAGATLVLSGGTFTNFSGASNGLIQAQTNSFLEFNSATVSGGTVDLAAGARLELNSSTVSGGTLTMTSTSAIETHSGTNFLGSTLSVPNGGTIEVRNATALKLLASGNLTNNGNLSLASTGSSTDLVVSGGDVTLAGAGTVTLSNRTSNHIYGQASTDRLINHNTIEGAGQIGLNSMGLVNAGTISANQSNSLTLDPSSAGVTNTGTLRATDGGTLVLAAGTFDNSSGLILADGTGSKVQFSNASISGGTLAKVGAGILEVTNESLFSGITLQNGTNLDILNGIDVTLQNTISNFGVISMGADSSSTDLEIASGGVTLSGTGSLDLSDSTHNRVLAPVSGATLTNSPGHTIRGSGFLGDGTLVLVNQGTIEATQTTPLTIDVVSTSTFTNQGTLRAKNGASLVLTDGFSNAGLIEVLAGSMFTAQASFSQTNAGIMLLKGGTVSAANTTIQSAGAITGSGTINGGFHNTGLIAPGESSAPIGALTFSESIHLGSSSLLSIQLGGPASFDQITAPSAVVGGMLAVSFVNGFQNSALFSHTFTILSTTMPTGLSGTFLALPNFSRVATIDGHGSFKIEYLSNAVQLSEFQAIPEPSTYVLLGTGALLLVFWHRRRRA